MPVAIDNFNLVIPKSVIAKKYAGGEHLFRLDVEFDTSPVHIEDNELFVLRAMNVDDFDLDLLINNGLHYDQEKFYSTDFSICTKLDGMLWPVDWLVDNHVFIWHQNASAMAIEEARHRGECSMSLVETVYGSFAKYLEVIW